MVLRFRAWRVLVAIAALGCNLTYPSLAAPLKIRIGYQAMVDKLAILAENRRDIATHLGKSYTIDLALFNASSLEVTALLTGDIDIATLGYSSLGIALDGAEMKDLRLIADGYRDGVDGFYSNDFMVLKDSPIQKVEDLKGKVLASNGAGSVVDIAMRYMLKKHGLQDRRDYVMVEAALPTMMAMLQQRKADLVTMNSMYAHDPKIVAATRALFREKDALGITEFAFYCARTGFLERNKAALEDFMEDFIRITRWTLDPNNRSEAIKIFAKQSRQNEDVLSTYFLQPDKDVYRDLDARPDVQALQRNLDAMSELGFLKSKIDVAPYVDLAILEAAVARVGTPSAK